MVKLFPITAFILLLVSCTPTEEQTAPSEDNPPQEIVQSTSEIPFVKDAEIAHKTGSFQSKEVIAADLVLNFGGKERVRGTMRMLTNTGKLRLDETNGITTVFDGKEVYLSPDTLEGQGKRFGIFTWTYFMALPYKLSDPGTIWNAVPFDTLQGQTYNTQKLTFADGTGDSSLDWYILYTNQETGLIDVAAYIVTYSSGTEEAEEDPHAITYHDYRDVDGIPIAHEWKFWAWREIGGLTEQLGDATLANIRFEEETAEMFAQPAGARAVPYERAE